MTNSDPYSFTKDEKAYIETVTKWFRDLQNSLFSVLPRDCILKMRDELDKRMISMLNSRMVAKGLVKREDICLLCNVDICPWNSKVSYRFFRYLKILILGQFYKTDFTKLLKSISR